jgi:hypothetical protein
LLLWTGRPSNPATQLDFPAAFWLIATGKRNRSILPGRQGIRRAHPQHGCESTNQWLNMAAKNLRSCLKDFNVED